MQTKRKSKTIEEINLSDKIQLRGSIEDNNLETSKWEFHKSAKKVIDLGGSEIKELYEFLQDVFGDNKPTDNLQHSQATIQSQPTYRVVQLEDAKDPVVEMNRHRFRPMDDEAAGYMALLGPPSVSENAEIPLISLT